MERRLRGRGISGNHQSRSRKQQQTPSNANDGFRPLTSPVTKIRRNNTPSPLRRGGVAYGRGSISPRSRGTRGIKKTPLEKGGVWRTIDDDEVAAGPVLRSPRDNSNDKFQEFRRRWEEKNKGIERRAQIKESNQTRPVEKVLRAGSGGKESKGDGEEIGRKVATKTELDVWEDEKDKQPSCQLPVLRDPRKENALTNNISKQRQDSFGQKRNAMMGKASSVSVEKSGASRPVPLSWQLATTVGGGSTSKVDVPESKSTEQHGTISFVSPLELSYPLPQTLSSQLHQYSWDAKRRADSSFGSFLLTNSILNPILPTLPRISKPENLIVIEIDPQENKSNNELENWDPIH